MANYGSERCCYLIYLGYKACTFDKKAIINSELTGEIMPFLRVLFRSTSSFFLLFTLLFTVSGCSETPPPTAVTPAKTPPPVEQPKTIALVMKTLTNPFFIEMERGARTAEQELGIKLVVKTAAQETSIQQQIGIVEGLIQEQVDAIVIAPGDSVELIPVLKQAKDAGIVVVNIDNRLDPVFSKASGLSPVPFISVDNEQAAYDSVRALLAELSGPTDVVILEGIRGAENAKARKAGAVRALGESDTATLVASETAHWKIDEAYDVTAKLLQDHPGVGAIFCANDMMALGTIKYLQDNDRTDIKVAGYDALEQAVDAVKAGQLVATIDQQAAEQGYQGVLFAFRALLGERLPSVILIDTRLITKATL